MPLAIPVDKLLTWSDTNAQQWRDFALAKPVILMLPCDIRNSKFVADTFQHIFAAELRYAQRLSGLPESPYEEIPKHSIKPLFEAHRLAFEMVRNLLAQPDYDWSTEITFETLTMGRLRASRETILVHLTLHSIRHYAQLATHLRREGFKPKWPMDYLFADAQQT